MQKASGETVDEADEAQTSTSQGSVNMTQIAMTAERTGEGTDNTGNTLPILTISPPRTPFLCKLSNSDAVKI